jgi:hypothetical protein
MKSLAGSVLAMAVGIASAASFPVVEGVQSPAWVERGGSRQPLAVGMPLLDKDTVLSGDDARILLRMPEGSLVKLGANGQLALDRLVSKRDQQAGFFSASLDVLRGAFRFTTQATSRFRGRREVDVRIATVTAGIRGTDLWGKAADDRDIVCLIEGKISVQRQGEAQFTMDQPLSFYIAPRGEAALPVAPVPVEKLKEWAAETEIQSGGGAARRGGRWKVYVAEAPDQQEALKAYDGLRSAGFPAEIRPQHSAGRIVYQVRLSNLPSEAEARSLASRIKGLVSGYEPRVTRS